MKSFKYEIGMTEEEMTERVLEMIAYMRTDEYWLERSGNSPYYLEGGELMQKYLETTDGKKTERRDTLIVPYNRVLRMNMVRPDLVNRTKEKQTVTMTMMSGKEFEVSLEHIATYADLVSEVWKELTPKKGIRISIVDGERVLSSSNPRLIITDDTVLTVVLSISK